MASATFKPSEIRHFHFGARRTLCIELVGPEIERGLIANHPASLEFAEDIQKQTLVCSVVLGTSGTPSHQINTQDQQPSRKSCETQQSIGRSKRRSIVASQRQRQAVSLKELFKSLSYRLRFCVLCGKKGLGPAISHWPGEEVSDNGKGY